MSKNTADNKESFDIDFSDLLVQDLPVDTKKIDNTDTGLSADDLSFLESLSQFPEPSPAPAEPKAEPPKVDNKPEAPKTVLHPSLMDDKEQVDTKPIDEKTDKSGKDAINDLIAPPPAKKSGLFGSKSKDTKDKKDKKGKKDDNPFAKAPPKKPAGKKDLKKQLTLILGVMGVILVLGLLWVFLGKSEDPAPMPEPAPVETQAPTPEPTPEVAPETPEAPEETAEATAENTDTPALTGDFTPIDADAIVQAEIPDDPALIKEEIDRLADENSRLLDQAKDIDGILSDTEKLTSAKEEQIALLEAQIAQLEAQKGK